MKDMYFKKDGEIYQIVSEPMPVFSCGDSSGDIQVVVVNDETRKVDIMHVSTKWQLVDTVMDFHILEQTNR